MVKMKGGLLPKNIKKINEIKNSGAWASVRVKVVQLWDNKTESLSQAGILGDETGTIKFVSWKKSGLPLLEENRTYLIKNTAADSWNENLRLNLNKRTLIKPLDEEIKPMVIQGEGLEGIIMAIIPESGLIFRCPHCKRVLIEDVVCAVHAEVERLTDLRIKARMETKSGSVSILLNRELTEKVIGMSLESAQKIGKQKVLETINERLIKIPFRVEGSFLKGGNFLVKKIMPAGGD